MASSPVAGGAEGLAEAVRAFVRERLPQYMVPSAVVVLEALPLTGNGKLDRAALPAPRRTGSQAGTGSAGEPVDARELVLCQVFAEVLGVAAVGLDEGFFDLGGDSILAIQLVARARAAGLVFAPKDVFRHQSVRELASVALEASQVESEEEGAGIGPVHPTPIMKWLGGLSGPITDFSQTVVLRVPPDLGLEPLTAAVQAVLDRHDTLRLAWHGIEGVRPVGGESAGGLEVLPVGAVRAAECVRRVGVTEDVTAAMTGAAGGVVAENAESAGESGAAGPGWWAGRRRGRGRGWIRPVGGWCRWRGWMPGRGSPGGWW
nr:hypothetical protein GCM10020093_038630 [Planobispora longispora]